MTTTPHIAPQMRYPDTTPMGFSDARRFVEVYGNEVWAELCDTVMVNEFFNVTDVAQKLSCLQCYRRPERYLRAVLNAVLTDYAERPNDYENRPPVHLRGARLDYACV